MGRSQSLWALRRSDFSSSLRIVAPQAGQEMLVMVWAFISTSRLSKSQSGHVTPVSFPPTKSTFSRVESSKGTLEASNSAGKGLCCGDYSPAGSYKASSESVVHLAWSGGELGSIMADNITDGFGDFYPVSIFF
jgi:hypothetical protein